MVVRLGRTFAGGLGCNLRQAHRLICSDGLVLGSDAAITVVRDVNGCSVVRVGPDSAGPETASDPRSVGWRGASRRGSGQLSPLSRHAHFG